jgi:hypothetical protein
MYRFRVPDIFLGCLLTIAVFAAGVVFSWNEQSANPKQTVEKQETRGERSKTESPDAELTGSTWLTKDAAGFFTFLLVAVGFGQAGLFFIQLRYMRKGMDDATMVAKAAVISADAAKKTADSIQITERPYIFVWGIRGLGPQYIYTSSTDPDFREVVHDGAVFDYSVSNRGKLAAVIERVSVACGYEKIGRYPPMMIVGDHQLLQSPIISPERDENISHRASWRDLDYDNPAPGFRDGLVFRVVVYYRGPFTKAHETSQCWRYANRINGVTGFEEIYDERYTYSK